MIEHCPTCGRILSYMREGNKKTLFCAFGCYEKVITEDDTPDKSWLIHICDGPFQKTLCGNGGGKISYDKTEVTCPYCIQEMKRIVSLGDDFDEREYGTCGTEYNL